MAEIDLSDQLSYSLRRESVDKFLSKNLASSSQIQLLLDLGGVKDQQRGRFRLPVPKNKVVAFNLLRTKALDINGDGADLPFPRHTFDLVICSEVLEHVPDPLIVAKEIFRVLKPGGKAILTVPFLFRLHADPSDFGRYTEWYWLHFLKKLGFIDIQMEKHGLFWSVAVDMLRDWLRNKAINGQLNRWQRSFAERIVRSFRVRAISAEEQQQTHPFLGQYTSGFGIVMEKSNT